MYDFLIASDISIATAYLEDNHIEYQIKDITGLKIEAYDAKIVLQVNEREGFVELVVSRILTNI